VLEAAQRLALRIDERRLAIILGAVIAALGIMGILRYGNKEQLGAFNLDGERNVPAAFSAALWTAVAALAVLVARAERSRVWFAFALVTLLVAADEFGEIHERLESMTGIDWQILYLPVGIVAAILFVVLGRRLWRLGTGFTPFVIAVAAGAASQLLEQVQYDANDEPVRGYRVMVVTEELLEMTAAVLIGLSLLAVLRALVGGPHDHEGRSAGLQPSRESPPRGRGRRT
jgi:hypothetical protein